MLVFMKDFKKLLVRQNAMEIIASSYRMAETFPSEEKMLTAFIRTLID